MKSFLAAALSVSVLLSFQTSLTGAEPRPIKALLVTGGCCHDYATQKEIIKQGLEARIHIVVDQAHTDDKSTRPPLPILGKPGYADGYDLVIHDECAADLSDSEVVKGVLAPHLKGMPGVNLHCAMHSYRVGNPNQPAVPGTPHALWFEYLGLQSSSHGPQQPIAISFIKNEHPILNGLQEWTTSNEELYNSIKLFESATPLARGRQSYKTRSGEERSAEFVIVWTNQYGPENTRVFSTSLGHNNATVEDPRYLDLLARGVLWATGHLKEDGSPAAGYGRKTE